MADSQRRGTVGRRRGVTWEHLYTIAIGAVIVGAVAVVAVVIAAVASDGGGDGPLGIIPQPTADPSATVTPTPNAEPTPTPTEEPTEDQPAIVACGDILARVNKTHRLPADCAPDDLVTAPNSAQGQQLLRAEAAGALGELFDAAERDGFTLYSVSAYRSYQGQVEAYEANRAIYGDEVDRYSARPGHSEHQLGTTVDISSASAGFGLEPFEGTPEAAWVAENSWRYGFIVSYPEGKEDVTGYAYEPWHIRYVGRDVAAQVHESGLTLHEFLAQR